MSESNRRAVDKATSLPSITIGFAILILAATWVLSQRTQQYTSESESTRVEVERNTKRFNQYSGADGSNTDDIKAARDREIERCIWLAVKLDDDSVPCT